MGSRRTNWLDRNRGAVGSVALGLGALVAVACATAGPEGGWKPAPYAPPPPPEADDEGFGDDDDDSFDEPSATATANPSASAPAAELRADGAGCSKGSECQSGICEGQGCEPDKGKCAPKERVCTGAKQQLCDCAGKTIAVDKASCPAVTYKYPGPCK
ncbi:MAG: hypothetical protein JRI68_05375 [Deltaproteobacteria bacterium]|nr:hypothetical protein [Deltaproteobacteria bacterium]